MNKIALTCMLLAASLKISAQGMEDVYRYTFLPLSGTSRVLGMGGTSVASGADITSAFVNPAGLGMFRENQYQFGLGFNYTTTRSKYIDHSETGSRSNLNLPHLGAVFNRFNLDMGKEREKGLINYSFSFGLNRSASFNRRFKVSGDNFSSSMTDYFAQLANGYSSITLSNDLNSMPGQAWNTFLINEDPSIPNTYSANLPDSILMKQRGEFTSSGRINDLNIGSGINISNKLYLGLSVSLNSIRYESTSVWDETTGNYYATPKSFRYESGLSVSASSFSARLGAIFRFNDYLRAGVSYQTKTKYFLAENYYNNMSSQEFAGIGVSRAYDSEVLANVYDMSVPSRLNAGITLLLPKRAMLNIEMENTDYSQSSLVSTSYSYQDVNMAIRNVYGTATAVRTGIEVLNGPYRFRAGYAWQESPIKKEFRNGYSLGVNNYTLGLGFRNRYGFFMDLAYVYRRYQDFYTPYVLNNSSRISYTSVNNTANSSINFTIGSSF